MYHGDLEMNIAVFVFAFPVLSETFVLNELVQLGQAGLSGTVWREKTGNGSSHPKLQQLGFSVHECRAKILPEWNVILAAHRWWLQRAPLRYFHTLIRVVWNFPDWESFKIFIKAAECAREISESSTDLLYVHESDRSFVFAYTVSQLSQRRLVMILHTYYLFVQNHYLASKIRLSDGVIFLLWRYLTKLLRLTLEEDLESLIRIVNKFLILAISLKKLEKLEMNMQKNTKKVLVFPSNLGDI
jgi:hypothetical protein